MLPLLDVNSAYTDAVTMVFSSTIAAKAWFATAAVVLAFVQILTASRMWGKLHRVVPISFPVAKKIHRWTGRLAFLCTLPVFFHCVFILGFQTPDARVAVHAAAGTVVYGVLAAKLLMIRHKGFALGDPRGGRDARSAARRAVADLESVVLHECSVRLLMRRLLQPLTLLVCVSGAVFALAQAHFFAPAQTASAGRVVLGDIYRGETVFQRSCASCHGDGGTGGGIGPKLQASGLTAAAVQARIRAGAGAMPAALVSGGDEADVVAYVSSIAASS